MSTYYLARFEPAGDSLFSTLKDAQDWADYQFNYRFPTVESHWVSGGEHGWYAQRWGGAVRNEDGHEIVGATVSVMSLDDGLPEWRREQLDNEAEARSEAEYAADVAARAERDAEVRAATLREAADEADRFDGTATSQELRRAAGQAPAADGTCTVPDCGPCSFQRAIPRDGYRCPRFTGQAPAPQPETAPMDLRNRLALAFARLDRNDVLGTPEERAHEYLPDVDAILAGHGITR